MPSSRVKVSCCIPYLILSHRSRPDLTVSRIRQTPWRHSQPTPTCVRFSQCRRNTDEHSPHISSRVHNHNPTHPAQQPKLAKHLPHHLRTRQRLHLHLLRPNLKPHPRQMAILPRHLPRQRHLRPPPAPPHRRLPALRSSHWNLHKLHGAGMGLLDECRARTND